MPGIENNWQLFGYDLRQAEKSWRLAWQQCLWGDDSPLKRQLDEPVRVHSGTVNSKEVAYYQAGLELDSVDPNKTSTVDCDAIILPDSLVLNKTLEVPLAAESELPAVMALEVSANSPFPADDTVSGWRLLEKTESTLKVQLVISSLGAIMQILGDEYQCHDPATYEIWAKVNNVIIMLDGFGKASRQQRYRKSLFRLGTVAGYCLLILVLMSAVFAGGRYLQLAKVQALHNSVESEAGNAVSLRNRLAVANEMITAGNAQIASQCSPHIELKRLSSLLSDNAWITNFQMNGDQLRVQGQGTNAADEMSRLSDEPAYAKVTAPRAISKIGGSSLERFSFDITLRAESCI